MSTDEKCEPKENDKCMDNSDQDNGNAKESTPKVGRFNRIFEMRRNTKDIKLKRHNLVIALLCVLLFLMFIIVLVLAVQVSTGRSRYREDECLDASCLQVASQVLAKMNRSYSPCDDFYHYSCQGWFSTSPLSDNKGSVDIKYETEKQVLRNMRHLIDLVPQDASEHSPNWKVKKFYGTCMDIEGIEYWSQRTLVREIIELGGWTILQNNPVSFQRWDRVQVIERLHVNYGVNPYFKISVIPDATNPSLHIIKIDPAGLGLPNKQFYDNVKYRPILEAYRDYIREMLKVFEADKIQANSVSDDILSYEKRLAEKTPSDDSLRQPISGFKKLTVKELNAIAPSIKWLNLFQAYFPQGGVSDDTMVAVSSEKYMADMSEIISTTDNGALNNYLMWRLAAFYAPHLSKNSRMLTNEFQQTLEGAKDKSKSSLDRWEFCLHLTSKYLGHAIGEMYVHQYFHGPVRSDVTLITEKLVSAAAEGINTVPWLRNATERNTAREKLHSIKRLIGYPDFILNNNDLTEYYKDYLVQNLFIQNIILGESFLRIKQGLLLQNTSNPDHNWHDIFAHNVKASYNYIGNTLVVAAGLLQSPLYDDTQPLSVKFGTLGGLIAGVMMQAFDDVGIEYQELGMLKRWISNASYEIYNEKKMCLEKNMESLLGNNVNASFSLDTSVGKIIASVAGLKYSFNAYLNEVENMGTPKTLPGIQHANEELFFISYAQGMCETLSPEKLEIWKGVILPKEIQVKAALQQLPEFLDTFSCSSSSKMYPKSQCNMW